MTSLLAILQTISMLCQVNYGGTSGWNPGTFERGVMACQHRYVECLDRIANPGNQWNDQLLRSCVREITKEKT